MADTRQVGALLLVTGVALAVWSFGDKDSNDKHEVTSKITTVDLDSPNADITIKVADVDKTTVEEQRTYWLVKKGDAYEVDGETLRLDGDCGWRCRADYVITVPRGTKVTGDNASGDLSITGAAGLDLRSRSGDIQLRDLTGDVKLNVTSGDLTLDNVDGKVDVEATSGDVEAKQVKGGPVRLRTTSGDLRVELAEPTSVDAEGTSSDIEVIAPAGAYKVHTETRSGDVKNDLTSDQSATHTIEATTVSGDVQLTSR